MCSKILFYGKTISVKSSDGNPPTLDKLSCTTYVDSNQVVGITTQNIRTRFYAFCKLSPPVETDR